MAVKLTKNEQKLQKDRLKQYQRYLPTLQLKKQQLQMVIRQISAEAASLRKKQESLVQDMQTWIAVYHENTAFASELKVEKLIKIDKVVKAKGNIAGVTIPVFKELTFVPISYNLADYPLWVDKGLERLRDLARYDALIATLEQQVRLLESELRITSQRVNLFEKVKIPEAKENIRRIAIYLGDQQTAAVVRGKIAKKKLMQGA
ncbi:V-type ATP synthase subunit D [Sphaerochaeta halotolerans]|jgi:V/A-type H+-transporting ATPase subunit D|uniref:V-type ATP synthase subunit D n=1 Tax=Sphaerochaeta halotolerans TaxID=2293840 RepID=A0A372MFI4_9SPIR|nr:V-type ATP synthase subunit D [Sphaerochaeta halotolerans]MBG0766259.1 V-type ATP synthase subunit D [Spirochaetaceae bacterium]MDK2859336.1 V/A-type H+/Na+-transporting ATPase subunit [Sphaerochaeta sp.]MDN5333645.1 V/A-type H+/Na+-transporting ATPase subunit [Sphaerochaeta sp.]MXI85815.1 V-type ATP synthase subunit D [Sphaerochaeta halotolerans]RFU94549.1 V-type ATP synthase subunit D [Sphaerochaeta halotolerans]